MPKLLALLLISVLCTSCGDTPKAGTAEQPKPCNGLDSPTAGAPTELPLGLPLTAGATVLRVETLGTTTVAFTKLPGDSHQLIAVRDRVLSELRPKGYTSSGLDAEPGFEAEAVLGGKHPGTLKVTPLCKDVLQIRYKING